jgi:NAD(P)-dependent dehydrogenase (short-subunit alcohol dehydrogenase family)
VTTAPVVLVTGSTDGIGRAAAGLFAARGASVLVHGKDPDKGARVLEELRSRSPRAEMDLVTADLRDPAAIEGLADAIRDRHGRLDLLVNNAGVFQRRRVLTEEGLETTFAVNALAPYRVTRALLPLLSPSGRVVNTASVAHMSTTAIDWENLQGERRYDGYAAYSLSKLGDVLMTRGFADRGVEAVSLHPGVCATKLLAAGFPGSMGAPPLFGGENEVRLATREVVESGAYYDQSALARPSRLARDPELPRRWCGLLQSFG